MTTEFSPTLLNNTNIIPIELLRRDREDSLRLANYVSYLSVLKTEELLIEVKELIRTLTDEDLSREMINRGKLILSEISGRLSQNSPLMSVAIKKIQKELESKIRDIEKLFVISID